LELFLEQLLLLAISIVANGLSALAGGGAGLLQFPALLLLGLSFAMALATHKVASVALGVGATLRHLKERRLDPRFALFMLAFGVPGVIVGALSILRVPDILAQQGLGVLTIVLGLYSMFSPNLGLVRKPAPATRGKRLFGGVVLFLIGVLNGSITSGTGLFVTIWLVIWFGLDYQRAVAYTLILVGLVWNGVGALTLALQTEVKWLWLAPLVLGALIGGYIGAHWSIVRGSRLVKRVFELVTVSIGLVLLLRTA
jgi:uncharacterized membrane protein YfcA